MPALAVRIADDDAEVDEEDENAEAASSDAEDDEGDDVSAVLHACGMALDEGLGWASRALHAGVTSSSKVCPLDTAVQGRIQTTTLQALLRLIRRPYLTALVAPAALLRNTR